MTYGGNLSVDGYQRALLRESVPQTATSLRNNGGWGLAHGWRGVDCAETRRESELLGLGLSPPGCFAFPHNTDHLVVPFNVGVIQ